MNWKTRLETNHRLWFYISAALFVALWCIPVGEGPKNSEVRAMFQFWKFVLHPEGFGAVMFLSFVFGFTAAISGWILQAIAVITLQFVRRDKSGV